MIPVSDIVNIGTIAVKVYQKCKNASKEYERLATLLKSACLGIESTRFTLKRLLEALPSVHECSLEAALNGLETIMKEISDDLDLETYKTKLKSKVAFTLLGNPREAESILSSHLSVLNFCLSSINLYVGEMII